MSRVLGIVGRVNMSRFMNGDLSMGWYVIRAGAVNKGVIGRVIMSRVLGIVGRVSMSRFMNGDLSTSWHVIRAGAVNKGIELIIVVTLGLYRNRSVRRIRGNQVTFDNSQRNNLRSCVWVSVVVFW